jgi:hypothetical protein
MNNDTAYTSNPANYYLQAAMDHHDRNEAAEWAERFDGDYSFDEGGWLKSFRFGVRHTFRQATTRETSLSLGHGGAELVGSRPSINWPATRAITASTRSTTTSAARPTCPRPS